MFKITNEEIPLEILEKFIPENIPLKEKLIRKINECYQWNINIYNQVRKGNYNFIEKQVEYHIFNFS